jgi:hypothetical protein
MENSTLLPDGAYRGALYELLSQFLPAYACRSASAHTPITVVRTEHVVMSFQSAPLSRDRFLLLSSIAACVYRYALLAEALDLIGTIITLLLLILHSSPRITLVRSEYILYEMI